MKKRMLWIVCIVLAAVLAVGHFGKPSVGESGGREVQYSNPAIKDGQWDVIRLGVVERWKYPAPPEGFYMTLTRVKEDAVAAVMHNDTEERWESDGFGHMLQVKLGDAWYSVPQKLGEERSYVLIGLSGFLLDPGQAVEQTYGLGDWGELPAGTYRMMVKIYQVKNAGTPEHRVISAYPTVEFEIP